MGDVGVDTSVLLTRFIWLRIRTSGQTFVNTVMNIRVS
jgi:hypothetical protein